jgi:hypothetical protein
MAGGRYALLVVSYNYDDPALQQLRSPRADAAALSEILRDPEVGGFSVDVLENELDHVVRQRLEEFFSDRDRDDLLLVHFSCHGVKDDDGNLYLATPNSKLRNLLSTTVPADFVRSVLESSRSRRILLLLDCCYSGAMVKGAKSGTQQVAVKEVLGGEGSVILTASDSLEYAFEGNSIETLGPHPQTSIFTAGIVEGLKGAACRPGQAWITDEDLYHYADRYVRDHTPNQKPKRFIQMQGDLLVARARAGGRSLAATYDYTRLRHVFTLQVEEGEAFCVDIAPTGRSLAAGTDGAVLYWQQDEHLSQWRSQQVPDPITIDRHEGYVYVVAHAPNDSSLASAGEDGEVHVIAREEGWRVSTVRKHNDAIYSLDFSPDGSLLVTGGYDRQVVIGPPHADAPSRTLPRSGRVGAVQFSPNPDDTTIAIGSLDNSVTLWNYRTGEVSELGNHLSSVESVTFSPDGSTLASAGLDKAVRLWDVRSRGPLWGQVEHEYLVRAVQFAPNGKAVISVGWDKNIKLWDVDSSMPYDITSKPGEPKHNDWIWTVAFSNDGKFLATGGSDGLIIGRALV